MTDERMEMLLKESFVNIRPGAELAGKITAKTVCTGAGTYRQTARGTGTICAGGS